MMSHHLLCLCLRHWLSILGSCPCCHIFPRIFWRLLSFLGYCYSRNLSARSSDLLFFMQVPCHHLCYIIVGRFFFLGCWSSYSRNLSARSSDLLCCPSCGYRATICVISLGAGCSSWVVGVGPLVMFLPFLAIYSEILPVAA